MLKQMFLIKLISNRPDLHRPGFIFVVIVFFCPMFNNKAALLISFAISKNKYEKPAWAKLCEQ